MLVCTKIVSGNLHISLISIFILKVWTGVKYYLYQLIFLLVFFSLGPKTRHHGCTALRHVVGTTSTAHPSSKCEVLSTFKPFSETLIPWANHHCILLQKDATSKHSQWLCVERLEYCCWKYSRSKTHKEDTKPFQFRTYLCPCNGKTVNLSQTVSAWSLSIASTQSL